MARFSFLITAILAAISLAWAQEIACGSGSPHTTVTGSSGAYTARRGSSTLYTGGDFRAAIQAAVNAAGFEERIAVMASGSIGASTITLGDGHILEACGTINVGWRAGHGAIEALNTVNTKIRYLTMTGEAYFGLRFYGTTGLWLGTININLDRGLGIRFDRDNPWNYNVGMNVITVTGASSHAIELWNIDGFNINAVYARNVGESGLLVQNSRNGWVGLVDGNNVATGTGYATFRMANTNGRLANGNYNTNIWVDRVVSRGGGRGVFCVSQSGGAVIQYVDLANNGNNAILIENCYNLSIRGGVVNGGGEVRLASRSEFPVNRDIWVTLTVNNNSVRETPCGTNTNLQISGNAAVNVC